MRRDLIDQVLVGAPIVSTLAGAVLTKAPLGSALRRRLLNFAVKRAFAAIARSDVEASLWLYEPDAEIWVFGMAGVGMRGYYMRDEISTLFADLDDAFGAWSWVVRAVVDGGDRLAVCTDFVAHGRSSGVRTTMLSGGTAIRLSARGKVVWQEWHGETDTWPQALAAVGLSE